MWRGAAFAVASFLAFGCGSVSQARDAGAAGAGAAQDSGAQDADAQDSSAQDGAPCQVLDASDSAAERSFGDRGTLSGNLAVVTAPGNLYTFLPSAAYLFEQSGGTWSERGTVTFKTAVVSTAMDGDAIFFGLDDASSDGSVSVYAGSASGFTAQQTLHAGGAVAHAQFGAAVAVQGDTAVVGAPGTYEATGYAGAAYVFSRSGSTWTQTQTLAASDGKPGGAFGQAVALDGATIAVGTYASPGAVYVFGLSGTTWVEQAKLVDPADAGGYGFGSDLAMDGGTLLVSASARVDVFVAGAQGWSLQTTLSSGPAVALDGDTAAISDGQATYVATRTGSAWSEPRKICPIANLLDLKGGSALIGSPGSNRDGSGSGAAYVVHFDAFAAGDDACACRAVDDPPCSQGTPLPAPDKLGVCPAGDWLFSDTICDLDGQNCNEAGDLLCHRSCTSNRDCPDPCRPHCASQTLWNGTDTCGAHGPLICSETEETGCGLGPY